MEYIGSVSELLVTGGMDATEALGVMIGQDAALRVTGGSATVCDVVLASIVLGIDSVEAVVEYADAALGLSRGVGRGRCA